MGCETLKILRSGELPHRRGEYCAVVFVEERYPTALGYGEDGRGRREEEPRTGAEKESKRSLMELVQVPVKKQTLDWH